MTPAALGCMTCLTLDAYDDYVGYSSSYEQAHARADGQSAASERHVQYLESMEAGS